MRTVNQLHSLAQTGELHPTSDLSIEELRERVNELEVENARLLSLEKSLCRNARLFEALLAHSHDSIVLMTPQLTFLKVVHSVLGYNDCELAGQPLLPMVFPDDVPVVSETFERVVSGQENTAVCHCRALDKDGSWRWMEVKMTDMLNDPDVQAIVLNSRRIEPR